MRKWGREHPKEKKDRNKRWRDSWKGILENEYHAELLRLNPKFVPLDKITPDFYDPARRVFIEVKRALPFKRCMWRFSSKYFPGLWFQRVREHRKTPTIDEQVEKYPKPLEVIVIHGLTGAVLTKVTFADDPIGICKAVVIQVGDESPE